MTRLTARDARTWWTSAVIDSDQFLLYCFDHGEHEPPDAQAIADLISARAQTIADLRIRVSPTPFNLDLPSWAPCDVVDVRTHRAPTFAAMLTTVAELFAEQVDATTAPWRVHVFRDLPDAPRCTGRATVLVLQVAHCLADGRRAADLVRHLLTDQALRTPVGAAAPPAPPALECDVVRAARGLARIPWDLSRTVVRGTRVDRARAEIARRTAAGDLPPTVPGCPLTLLNARPDATRDVSLLDLDRAHVAVAGHTVTVGALGAVSVAMERYLHDRGSEIPTALNAEVMVARAPRSPGERNAFGNCSVPLFPGTSLAARLPLIAAALDAVRIRMGSPLWRTVGAPDEVVPAFLTRLGIRSFDPAARPALMAGAAVVSSVYRGAADLDLLGGRSVWTAGFPALSPAMGLTHGVNGLGETVTVSATSSRTAVDDPDRYAALLAEAFAELRQLG